MKRLIVSVTVFILLLSCAVGFSSAETEEFSIRGGVKFGMTPNEVIEIEKSNGYEYRLTIKGEILYKTDKNYNLYYQAPGRKLGKLDIYRFEYDFDLVNQKMYHFYYVFDEQAAAYDYLYSALLEKYGAVDNSAKESTESFSERGTACIAHSRWAIPGDNDKIIIDLWRNSNNTCFLSYQIFSLQPLADEKESLDFGI